MAATEVTGLGVTFPGSVAVDAGQRDYGKKAGMSGSGLGRPFPGRRVDSTGLQRTTMRSCCRDDRRLEFTIIYTATPCLGDCL